MAKLPRIPMIRVTYGVTISFGAHHNVRPELEEIIILHQGQDPEEARKEAMERLRAEVHRLVDEELEANDCKPNYLHHRLRYDVLSTNENAFVFVVPQGADIPKEIDRYLYHRRGGHSLPYCKNKMAQLIKEGRFGTGWVLGDGHFTGYMIEKVKKWAEDRKKTIGLMDDYANEYEDELAH